MGLDIYQNQIEVITAEQMLDAYSSIGMPVMYRHWSFGKRFAHDEMYYRKGARSLAFEIVINSDPCINYIMEENSMTMQALVIAHAALGHNHFFKNNYLFQQWTQADAILDYLAFAKSFVAECEERFGVSAVEAVLDAAHALMNQGVSRNAASAPPLRSAREHASARSRAANTRSRSTTSCGARCRRPKNRCRKPRRPGRASGPLIVPEENLLYFLEKNAPKLEGWKRELLRIVRVLSHILLSAAPDQGDERRLRHLRPLRDHEPHVRAGPRHRWLDARVHAHALGGRSTSRRFPIAASRGFNPYALGFAMMRDIKRICLEPTDEDRKLVPRFRRQRPADGDAAGRMGQFPRRELHPAVPEPAGDARLPPVPPARQVRRARRSRVEAIHDEQGYREVRRLLARHYDVSQQDPDIQVTDADLSGSRRLVLTHFVRDGILLDKDECDRTLMHVARLWGFRVRLVEVDNMTGAKLREHETLPLP